MIVLLFLTYINYMVTIVTPIIAKVARKIRMKEMEERLHQMVNSSIEEILVQNRERYFFLLFYIIISINLKFRAAMVYTYEEDYFAAAEVEEEAEEISKEVRLFLSSTFRDMFNEREQLVKHAFPELSLYSHQNNLFFTEVINGIYFGY